MYFIYGSLRESEPESRAMFSRAPYRYTGRTLYQTQMNRNPTFSRSAGAHIAGSRSMDNCSYHFCYSFSGAANGGPRGLKRMLRRITTVLSV